MFQRILRILIVFALNFFGGYQGKPSYEFVQEPKIRVSWCIVTDGLRSSEECWYEADICGAIKNTSDKEWETVSIVFTVFDIQDEEIGDATTKMINVEAGEIWYFCAPLWENPIRKPKDFVLKEVVIEEKR